MRSAQQKILVSDSRNVNISVLLVSPCPHDALSLHQILNHRNWVVRCCSSCTEAVSQLQTFQPAVVICERDLPDGCWKDLHATLQNLDLAPALLVVSRHADEHLWAEVLNLGGYDVLLKPFDPAEVTRVVRMAWRFQMPSGISDARTPSETPEQGAVRL